MPIDKFLYCEHGAGEMGDDWEERGRKMRDEHHEKMMKAWSDDFWNNQGIWAKPPVKDGTPSSSSRGCMWGLGVTVIVVGLLSLFLWVIGNLSHFQR